MTATPIKTISPSNSKFETFLNRIEEDFGKIRQRAYDLFKCNGQSDGLDFDNWFKAERELFDVPPAELTEDETTYRASVAVPGFASEQLTVTATADSLTIRGEAEETKKAEKTLLSEFSHKQIFRHFHLDSPVDPDAVTANLENGVLKIELPKAQPARVVPVKKAAAKAA
ncbi:MAG: Hsp20/alpha crystallin family protein [Acidobacteria bacterium]|nr:Hsp20/alpha crystallin family protein [Acidobacteriota bacterium]